MSEQTPLRLVDPRTKDGDPIPFDRRFADRRSVSGRVTAIRTTKEDPKTKTRICSLQLRNISDIGVGGISAEPVDCDSNITVFFPPHGPDRGFDLTGKVVRCDRVEDGYKVGIQLDEHSSVSRHAS